MPRNSGPLIPDDDVASRAPASTYRAGAGRGTEEAEDSPDPRLLDLDIEEEPAFLRSQKRVQVRRGSLPRKTANRLKQVLIVMAVVCLVGSFALMLYRYGAHSWRFRVESSDHIEITGIQHVSRGQVISVMGADIGRNVFFVPLAERQAQLEKIPWVESASVMRLLPNRLKVGVKERVPMGFVQIGSKIALIDANGVVMDLPPGGAKKYSFPVLVGTGVSEPLSTRAARMKIYMQLMRELDSEGANYSKELSEVDLSDPDDVKVTTVDPNGAVLVHLGSADYLQRYKVYVSHLQEWRQQYQKLRSVDMRYERQVIVNPDDQGMGKTPAAAVKRVKR